MGASDLWDGIPDGTYTVRAFGADRRVVVRREVTVTMEFSEAVEVVPEHLSAAVAEQVRRQLV